jgi:low affinity Fe/Cu permease
MTRTRMPQPDLFRRVARATANAIGSPYAFGLAALVILVWAVTGPMFHYSDTWQLVINTGTTIITFLVVFAIQNTQNRDSKALHLKLDELLRAIEPARTGLCDLEDMPDATINRLDAEFRSLRQDPDALEHVSAVSGAAK